VVTLAYRRRRCHHDVYLEFGGQGVMHHGQKYSGEDRQGNARPPVGAGAGATSETSMDQWYLNLSTGSTAPISGEQH
jgi:hypothetical protein